MLSRLLALLVTVTLFLPVAVSAGEEFAILSRVLPANDDAIELTNLQIEALQEKMKGQMVADFVSVKEVKKNDDGQTIVEGYVLLYYFTDNYSHNQKETFIGSIWTVVFPVRPEDGLKYKVGDIIPVNGKVSSLKMHEFDGKYVLRDTRIRDFPAKGEGDSPYRYFGSRIVCTYYGIFGTIALEPSTVRYDPTPTKFENAIYAGTIFSQNFPDIPKTILSPDGLKLVKEFDKKVKKYKKKNGHEPSMERDLVVTLTDLELRYLLQKNTISPITDK